MNSRTSRPRSPTSASTVTAASVPRVIIDSSVDLPTPEPAKMPMRWPRPHGTSVSSARTPSGSGSVDHAARRAGAGPGGRPRRAARGAARGRRRSGGRARRARGRAVAAPTGTEVAPSAASARSPARTPRSSPSGMHTRPSSCTATTSATTGPVAVRRAPPRRSAAAARRSRGSSPTTRRTRPCTARSRRFEHLVEQGSTRRSREDLARPCERGARCAASTRQAPTSTMQSPGATVGSGTSSSAAAERELRRSMSSEIGGVEPRRDEARVRA